MPETIQPKIQWVPLDLIHYQTWYPWSTNAGFHTTESDASSDGFLESTVSKRLQQTHISGLTPEILWLMDGGADGAHSIWDYHQAGRPWAHFKTWGTDQWSGGPSGPTTFVDFLPFFINLTCLLQESIRWGPKQGPPPMGPWPHWSTRCVPPAPWFRSTL